MPDPKRSRNSWTKYGCYLPIFNEVLTNISHQAQQTNQMQPGLVKQVHRKVFNCTIDFRNLVIFFVASSNLQRVPGRLLFNFLNSFHLCLFVFFFVSFFCAHNSDDMEMWYHSIALDIYEYYLVKQTISYNQTETILTQFLSVTLQNS